MSRDPFIREKFTPDLSFARQLAREYFQRYPKDRYRTNSKAGARSSLRISSFDYEAVAGAEATMSAIRVQPSQTSRDRD